MFIRRAIPSEAESIALVRVRAWRAAYKDFMPDAFLASMDPSANLDSRKATLQTAKPELLVKVAESDGRVSAFSILGSPRYEATVGTIELWALNVDPDAWRQGLGRRLVQEALSDALALSASRVELWCISGNQSACALYEACGFCATGKSRITSNLNGHPIHEVSYEKAF